MHSFTLLRTNPKLTTNVKILYDNNKVYLDCFNVIPELNKDRYNKFIVAEDSSLNIYLPRYWNNTPKGVAYHNKDDKDFDVFYSNYDKQIDDTYISGTKRIYGYEKEYEYFSPIYIYPNDIPDNFIIFRSENPGVSDTNSENFRENILNNLKVVENFNLNSESKLGKVIQNTYTEIESDVSVDFNKNEFTYWNGIDYKTGEYVSKGKIMDDKYKYETTFTDGHDILTSGYEDNGIIYPNILNMGFLFNDIVSDENEIKYYSINRYLGFYGDLEKIDTIALYRPPSLKEGLRLNSENILTFNGEPIDPFKRGYKQGRKYYVEYNSNYYLISRINNTTFKIISDIDLPREIDENYNVNIVSIENNFLKIDNSFYGITDDSDILVIKIDGKYHRLIEEDNKWKILSDYTFVLNNNLLTYYINRSDDNYRYSIDLSNMNPISGFDIYRFNMKEIKDFDSSILDTDFSKFEYEHEDSVTKSEEPKLYESDFDYIGYDKPIEKYVYNKEIVSIPVSTEYLASNEIFSLKSKETEPISLWKKNPEVIKWGLLNSISSNDYPYMFNINRNADSYNQTTDTESLRPDRTSRNLDYFYTTADDNYNFGYTDEVIYQSLATIHDKFDVEKVFTNMNYFNDLFANTETYKEDTYYRNKYSSFNKGDSDIPSQTNFKGIDFSIYNVDKIDISNNTITKLNVSTDNEFENYKLSIILANMNKDIDNNFEEINTSDWKLIRKWERNTTYFPGDIVLFDGSKFKKNGQYGFPGYTQVDFEIGPNDGQEIVEYTYPNGETQNLVIDSNFNITEISPTGPNGGLETLYICSATTSTNDPNSNLDDNNDFNSFPNTGFKTIFYDKNEIYSEWTSSLTYNFLTDKTNNNYNFLSYVIYYKGEFYVSIIENNNYSPEEVLVSDDNGLQQIVWKKVGIYNSTTDYNSNELVVIDGDLYFYDNITQDLNLIYSFKPDNRLYDIYEIVKMNGNNYIAMENNSSIDSGINIYINKISKNILIQLHISNIESHNSNRELLYRPDMQYLTATNFIEVIDSLTIKNGFLSGLKYYIIDENGFQVYNNENINETPYIIQASRPTKLEIYSHSLTKKKVDLTKDNFKVKNRLINNEIRSIDELNYYNNQPIAFRIVKNDELTFEDKTEFLYRHNGYYSPIFKSIPMFDRKGDSNYKFNENLKNFGYIKELVKSKVNEIDNTFINSDSKNIYTQINDIGYFVDNHCIFKSTWDKKYYKRIIK